MSKKLEIMDDLMSSITQTEFWKAELMQNPEIRAADKVLSDALDKLRGIAPGKDLDQLTDAAYSYASAFENAAILYEIYVAHSLHDVAACPSKLSQYILDRMARRRENG